MTKTHRRRSRAARRGLPTVAPLDHAEASKLLEKHSRWPELCEASRGLLEIEFTSPFIDTEFMCPDQAHLVVHLQLIQGAPRNSSRHHDASTQILDLQRRVARALEAIGTLCATAKRLSPWTDLYHRFWERVCACDAMVNSLQPSTTDKWVQYTKARGIPLLLSWYDKPIDPDLLIEPLQAFLSTPHPMGYQSYQLPVMIGYRFAHAAITASVMERLCELLLQPPGNAEALLVDPTSLRTLWFKSNAFFALELSVLASSLGDPKARRVDELRLEDFIEEGAPGVFQPAFSTALSQVFVSAVTAKSTNDPPLSLSIAENALSSERIDALREALSQATRRLCALSLSNIYHRTRLVTNLSAEAWKSLADLIFQPLPTATPCAVLDLSGVRDYDQIPANLELLIHERIESLWSRGFAVEENVECSFSDAYLYESPGDVDLLEVNVLSHTFYKVEGYLAPTRSLLITVQHLTGSGEIEPVTGWVSISSATQVRIDGVDIVGTSFTRVIYDSTRDDWTASSTAHRLTASMGSSIKALSFRNYSGWGSGDMFVELPKILARCPHLEELSLQGGGLTAHTALPFWEHLDLCLPALRVLDISQCELRDMSLHGLERFPLQYLSMLLNPIGARGVKSLLTLLHESKQLHHTELNPQTSEPPSQCIGLRCQIDEMLARDYLRVRDKAAVLSVLAHIQRRHPRRVYPGDGVVALVFSFAGTKPKQIVKWIF